MSNGFKGKISQAQQRLESLQSKTQDLQKLKADMSAFEKLRTDTAQAGEKLGELQHKLERVQTQRLDQGDGMSILKSRLIQAQSNLDSLSKSYPKNSAQVKAAREEVKKLSGEYKAAQKTSEDLKKSEQSLAEQTDKAREAFDAKTKRLEEMQNALQRAGVNTKDLAGEQNRLTAAITRANEAQQRYTEIRSQLTWGNFKADIMKGLASFEVFKQPVSVNMNFEQAMADVAAVARPTAEELSSLTNQAKELGRSTQFTAMDAAQAQQNLIRSGMKAGEVIEAMPAILNLAAAEGLSIDEASSIIAKSLGGMNLGAEMAPRLADVLAYVSANSNTNIPMLGEALKVAAPVAASQNVKLEQIASYLGIMANKGFEGSEAGNAIASSFQRLAKRPASTLKALNELGVKTRTKSGKMVELPEIMKQLNAAFTKRKMGENEQLGYLANIFGSSYGKHMMGFMQAVIAGEQDALEVNTQEKSQGWAGQSTAIRTNTLSGDLAGLSSAWEGLMNRIGQTFNPWVRTGVRFLTDITNKITDLIEKSGIWGDVVLTIGGAFTSWKVISTVWKYASLLVKLPFAKLGVSLAEGAAQAALTGEKIGLIPAIVGKISGAFGWLKGIILAHPLLAIGALAGVVTYEVIQHWETVKSWFQSWIPPNVWESLSAWCEEMIAKVKTKWQEFTDWLSSLNPFKGWSAAADKQIKVNQNAMQMAFGAPGFEVHAEGGIMTRPHLGMVAEAGPEAIVPLRDKSRGIEVLTQAAGLLGLNVFNQKDTASPVITNYAGSNSLTRSIASYGDVNKLTRSIASYGDSGSIADYSEVISSVNNYVTPARAQESSPTLNLTVNIEGNTQDESNLASRIADAVRQAWSEMLSLEERVSYA